MRWTIINNLRCSIVSTVVVILPSVGNKLLTTTKKIDNLVPNIQVTSLIMTNVDNH